MRKSGRSNPLLSPFIILILCIGPGKAAQAQTGTTTTLSDSLASLHVLDSFYSLAWELAQKGNTDQAFNTFEETKKITKKQFGKTSIPYAEACQYYGELLSYFGRDKQAEQEFLEALKIRKETLGATHSDYAYSLTKLGEIYTRIGKYEQALDLIQEALEINENTLGKDHENYVEALSNLASIYDFKGQFHEALALQKEALKTIEKTFGKMHPFYGTLLSEVATLYQTLGQYDQALVLYQEALLNADKTLGQKHPDYSTFLNNLALCYDLMGQFNKALPLYHEALEITANTLGEDHEDFGFSLNNLAALYNNLGQFDKAEPLFLKALNIIEKTLGKDHIFYGNSLSSLASFYESLGQDDKALQLYLESQKIIKNALGAEHAEYGEILILLAGLYQANGQNEKALPLCQQALEIIEKTLGKQHEQYAATLSNLAIIYADLDQLDKAESIHIQALEIIAKALGKTHPIYGYDLTTLADFYLNLGEYRKAEPLYLEALGILEKALGKADPWYARTHSGLTFLYELESRYEESTALMAEALPLEQATIARGITFLSEQELASYIEVQQQSSADLIAYLYARPRAQVSVLPDLTYDQVLFQKGFLLQAASRLQALATSTPEATEISNNLKAYRRRIASELSKPSTERQDLEELETKANALEQQLARTIAGYTEAQKQVHWKEVQNALPGDAIVLEFIDFEVSFPDLTDSIQYAVLLLRPSAKQPLFIPLFEEKEFDHLLNADKERKADYVNELYAWADRGMVKLGQEKKSLYDLIWAKIEAAELAGIKTVYYSPSGVLHRLNLGAIAIDDETILSDRYNLVALNSTRQLVIPSTVTTQAKDALLVGGVEFDVEISLPKLEDQPHLASRSTTESPNQISAWSYLKWTAKEVERIANSLNTGGFDVGQLIGSGATEETIKAIGKDGPSPRILHIATHGFFFPDPEIKKEEPGLEASESVFKNSDNPMIRSGLILAGGNYAWQHGQAVNPDKEDGILTAYEISQMNLANTELVVLSACETGLGDIQGNEGVYGLQRAFKIAGAKYLIMSLWQVPDRETMEFMTAFYRNWLEENMTIPDAFRMTQREMRDRFFNPYSWAGFVLVE